MEANYMLPAADHRQAYREMNRRKKMKFVLDYNKPKRATHDHQNHKPNLGTKQKRSRSGKRDKKDTEKHKEVCEITHRVLQRRRQHCEPLLESKP